MNKEILLKLSIFASFFLTIMGSCFKTLHLSGAAVIMAIGSLSYLIFAILSISEVSKSEAISKSEKSMWICGLIMIVPILGFIYLFSTRKRIVKSTKS